MLKLKDKQTGEVKNGHIDSIDELLAKARQHANNPDLVYWRKRVGLNEYIVEIWDKVPFENPSAKFLFYIDGIKRKNLNMRRKLIGSKPERKLQRGQNNRPPNPPGRDQ